MRTQRLKRIRRCALILALLLSMIAPASARGPVSQRNCRYSYQLVQEPSTGNTTKFSLYVERTDPNSPPLHSGTIAMAFDNTTIPNIDTLIHFTEESGWHLISAPSAGTTVQNMHTAKTASGLYYFDFGWYWNQPDTSLPDSTDGTVARQKLGTLEFDFTLTKDDILLVPWVQTETGGKDWQKYQTAVTSGGDTTALLEVIQNTWRMDNLSRPFEGYYQGYFADDYVPEGTTASEDAQFSVDIYPGWYGFRIGAYAPERDATLSFYRMNEETGQYGNTPACVMSASFGTGTGYFKKSINFTDPSKSGATLSHRSGAQLEALATGTYRMVLEKQSHVTATFDGLTISEDERFEELLGTTVILPCGDVDGDNRIRQTDHAQLTTPSRYGRPATGTMIYDLDGDKKVNQADLAILTAPVNYGKNALKFDFTPTLADGSGVE